MGTGCRGIEVWGLFTAIYSLDEECVQPYFFASSMPARRGHGIFNNLLYKVKFSLWIFKHHLIIRYRGNGVVAPRILYLGNRWTPVVTLPAWSLSLRKISPLQIGQDTGWVQGPVCGQDTVWVQGPACGQDTGWVQGLVCVLNRRKDSFRS